MHSAAVEMIPILNDDDELVHDSLLVNGDRREDNLAAALVKEQQPSQPEEELNSSSWGGVQVLRPASSPLDAHSMPVLQLLPWPNRCR